MIFNDRQGTNLNRKRLTIISQTPTEIIADIERADTITQEGTKINASVFNAFQNSIDTAASNATDALSQATSANTRVHTLEHRIPTFTLTGTTLNITTNQ